MAACAKAETYFMVSSNFGYSSPAVVLGCQRQLLYSFSSYSTCLRHIYMPEYIIESVINYLSPKPVCKAI